MIGKIAICKLSLLKWLPVIAAMAFVFAFAPKAAMAQGTSYSVTGCDIVADNGTYSYVAADYYGNPYYENSNGKFLYAARDDQERRDYYLWYIGTNYQTIDGLFFGNGNDDYSTANNAGTMSGDPIPHVYDTPAYSGLDWGGDVNGNSNPTVTAG